MIWTSALFGLGLVVLIVGAELLVRGASRLSFAAGISPLVVGLTVVAFGTSSPELAVTLQSTFNGQPDLAMGNVVGSNILNILLILGASALITPLIIDQKLIRREVPLLILVSVLVLLMSSNLRLGRIEGLTLVAILVTYIALAIRQSRRETQAIAQEYRDNFGPPETEGRNQVLFQLFLIATGLILLVIGSNWLVEASVAVARALGISELIVGLTIIAGGTSLPEVATSLVAALRGQRDIAVGNVVGSNLFNLLCVLGLAAVVAPAGISVAPSLIYFDLPLMVAASIACLPIFFTGLRISRWEGALFLGCYGAYTGYLILYATSHDFLDEFRTILLIFALPLTVGVLGLSLIRSFLREKK